MGTSHSVDLHVCHGAIACLIDTASNARPSSRRVSSSIAESLNASFGREERAMPLPAFLETVLRKWARLLDRRHGEVEQAIANLATAPRPAGAAPPAAARSLTTAAKKWLLQELKVRALDLFL